MIGIVQVNYVESDMPHIYIGDVMPKKDDRLLIYEKFEVLIFYSKNLLNKFPKSERFDLCVDIKKCLFSGLRYTIAAWKEYDVNKRIYLLRSIDIEIMVLKTLIKLSYQFKYISEKNYMTWNEKTAEIGRLVGGWIKSCQGE